MENGANQPGFQLIDLLEPSVANVRIEKRAPGRPTLEEEPLSNYPDPKQENELARNSKEILENFRFYGILLKKKHDLFRRIETITSKNPKCLDDLRSQYGPGEYELRQVNAEGNPTSHFFAIEEERKSQPDKEPGESAVEREQRLAGLRSALKEEIRKDFKAEVERLQARLSGMTGELDEKSKKIRGLYEEIGEMKSRSDEIVQRKLEPLQTEIKTLERDNHEKEMDILRLELQIQNEGIEVAEPTSFIDVFKEALQNPNVVQLLAPVFFKVLGINPGQVPAAGTVESPQLAQESPPPAPEQPAAKSPEPSQTESTESTIGKMIQSAAQTIAQTAMAEAMSENPSGENVNKVIAEQLGILGENGIVLNTNTWINIIRAILSAARQENVNPANIARVMVPIINQFGNVKNLIVGMPINIAVTSLETGFGLTLEPGEKEYLKLVIQHYKDFIKRGTQS